MAGRISELTPRCQFLIECLDLEQATQVEGARWEPFQIAHLCDDSVYRIEDKARQIAWSWTVAAEAVADALLNGRSTAFVSINLGEAREKIRYARRILDSLNAHVPTLVRDNELELELAGGARLVSLPSKAPRGKARMNVVLDEFAHVQHDKKIYTGALPVTAKGGRLRIGSSPMGASGMHWEISQQKLRPYPGFSRARTPWWAVRAFCKDVRRATGRAELLTTDQRVERFGKDAIRAFHSNMTLEDFQQEFECMFVDDSVAWITWEMIRDCQDDQLRCWRATSPDQVTELVNEMQRAISVGAIERAFVGGVDIGRKRNLTEVTLLGLGHSLPVRLMVSLDRVEYDIQDQILRQLMRHLPIVQLLIDQNGIGNQLAEDLSRGTVAEGVTFTNETKRLWAVEARLSFERRRVAIPVDRELAYQIHSIKRMVTAAKNLRFDTAGSEKHHADRFWSLALALWAAKRHEAAPVWGSGPEWRR